MNKTIELSDDQKLKVEIHRCVISFELWHKVQPIKYCELNWYFDSNEAMRSEMGEMVKQRREDWLWGDGGYAICFNRNYPTRIQDKVANSIGVPRLTSLKIQQLQTFLREQFGKVERPEVRSGDVLICDESPWVKFPNEYYLSATDGMMICASKFEPVEVIKHYRNGELIWERG